MTNDKVNPSHTLHQRLIDFELDFFFTDISAVGQLKNELMAVYGESGFFTECFPEKEFTLIQGPGKGVAFTYENKVLFIYNEKFLIKVFEDKATYSKMTPERSKEIPRFPN